MGVDTELCANDTHFPDIFESYTNSSIEIYYVEYKEHVSNRLSV